jgi:hypothetical protein
MPQQWMADVPRRAQTGDRALVPSFIDALVTKTRRERLTAQIS